MEPVLKIGDFVEVLDIFTLEEKNRKLNFYFDGYKQDLTYDDDGICEGIITNILVFEERRNCYRVNFEFRDQLGDMNNFTMLEDEFVQYYDPKPKVDSRSDDWHKEQMKIAEREMAARLQSEQVLWDDETEKLEVEVKSAISDNIFTFGVDPYKLQGEIPEKKVFKKETTTVLIPKRIRPYKVTSKF